MLSINRGITVILSILVLFSSVGSASAQQQKQGGSGLTISPTRAQFVIEKGKAENISISLKNTSGVSVVAKAVVEDFTSDNESGEPKIIVKGKNDLPTSVKKFLVGVGDVELSANETVRLDIPVQVPANAISGAYYGVIRYTAEAVDKQESNKLQVALNASIGFIVLIQVPGNITEQVQAKSISVGTNNASGSFFTKAPKEAYVTVKNTGNGFTKPFGRVIVSKGNKEVFNYEMNNTDPRSNVLPGATRTFNDQIKNIDKIGRYTITANVSYGAGGDILSMRTSFWIVPLPYLIGLIAVLVLVAVIIFVFYRRIAKTRKYRRK